MIVSPDPDGFAAAFARGETQAVWTRLVDDLETPVSAFLKIGHERPYAFLFESVEGGAWRGRYSIVALKPDLVWRCRGERARRRGARAIPAGAPRGDSTAPGAACARALARGSRPAGRSPP